LTRTAVAASKGQITGANAATAAGWQSSSAAGSVDAINTSATATTATAV
jgi:hypothetical protein